MVSPAIQTYGALAFGRARADPAAPAHQSQPDADTGPPGGGDMGPGWGTPVPVHSSLLSPPNGSHEWLSVLFPGLP